MIPKETFRIERQYYKNMWTLLNLLKDIKENKNATEIEKIDELLTNAIEDNKSIIIIYKHLGQLYNDISSKFEELGKGLQELKDDLDNWKDEINIKIDDVNNTLMVYIRELETNLQSIYNDYSDLEDRVRALEEATPEEPVYYYAGDGILIDNNYTIFNESYLPYADEELLLSGNIPDGSYLIDNYPLGISPNLAHVAVEFPSTPTRSKRFVIKGEKRVATSSLGNVPYALRVKTNIDPVNQVVNGIASPTDFGCMNGNVIINLELEYKENSRSQVHIFNKSIIHPFNAILDGDGIINITDVINSYPAEINELVDFSGIYTRNKYQQFNRYILRYSVDVEGLFTFLPSISDSNCLFNDVNNLVALFNSPLYFNELTIPYDWN